MIFETIIITVDSQNQPHIAPFGVKYENQAEKENVIISPYKPSITLANILATKTATLNITDDVRVFAGALTDNIQSVALQANNRVGYRLANALSYSELRLIDVKDDVQRPQLTMQKVHSENLAPFLGFNRARAAVIELAVLASRLHLLPREKVVTEMQYLQIAIDKTASERELEAWGWLAEKIEHFYTANKA